MELNGYLRGQNISLSLTILITEAMKFVWTKSEKNRSQFAVENSKFTVAIIAAQLHQIQGLL